MVIVFLVLIILLIGLAWLFIAEKIDLPTATPDTPENYPVPLQQDFEVADVAKLRFATALRGYRMDQVDSALLILQKRLLAQEEQIRKLHSEQQL